MQRISISYHDYLPYGPEYPGQPMPEIKVQKGTAAGPEYAILQIGASFDVFISRDRLEELRDVITAYLEAPGENAEASEPDMNADSKANFWDVPEAK